MTSKFFERDLPAMPRAATLAATVRDLGSRDAIVARVRYTDPEGEILELDLDQDVAWSMLTQLIRFEDQIRLRGDRG